MLHFSTDRPPVTDRLPHFSTDVYTPAWRSAWEQRFRAARYANFDSFRRVLDIIIGLAEGHHRRHDWKAFGSACRYLHRLASGEEWDGAEQITDPSALDILQ